VRGMVLMCGWRVADLVRVLMRRFRDVRGMVSASTMCRRLIDHAADRRDRVLLCDESGKACRAV